MPTYDIWDLAEVWHVLLRTVRDSETLRSGKWQYSRKVVCIVDVVLGNAAPR